MTEQEQSAIDRIKSLFGVGEADPGPEEIVVPSECPNCNLPVSQFALKDRADETVSKSWSCIYCGNTSTSEPDRPIGDAHERFREKAAAMNELVEELDNRD